MSIPNAGHSGDESLKNRDTAPAMEMTLTRPRYAKLRAYYHHVAAEGLLQQPIDRRHVKAWAHAQQDFEDALLELLPSSGLGTEHARVTNAAITLHDWLRLYQEVIKQPPPDGLREIERLLCERRDDLNRLYPPATHQPD